MSEKIPSYKITFNQVNFLNGSRCVYTHKVEKGKKSIRTHITSLMNFINLFFYFRFFRSENWFCWHIRKCVSKHMVTPQLSYIVCAKAFIRYSTTNRMWHNMIDTIYRTCLLYMAVFGINLFSISLSNTHLFLCAKSFIISISVYGCNIFLTSVWIYFLCFSDSFYEKMLHGLWVNVLVDNFHFISIFWHNICTLRMYDKLNIYWPHVGPLTMRQS